MKIKLKQAPIEEVLAKRTPHKKPKKPNILFRTLLRLASIPDLWATNFSCERVGMERLHKKQPCLILMNHSSFIDFEVASTVFYPRPLNIVATFDAFIGKDWLMRQIGCLETKKFTVGAQLIRDMSYALKTLKTSVLLFPEAGYSLDGTSTVLPESIGKCVKLFGVPLVSVTTYGAFARQPLYNNLRKRKVKVKAKVEYLLSPEEIQEKTVEEINEVVFKAFAFDNFRYQKENNIVIADENRAEGLERILYKCPCCQAEGKTEGKGKTLTCHACGKVYEMTELGEMKALDGNTEISHIPDWYQWEREQVKAELEKGEYGLDIPVDILIMTDTKSVYEVGEGRLEHNENGFRISGCDGKLDYRQSATAIYSINADFFWYQIADTVNIGDHNVQYFCFPKDKSNSVAKVRLAAEELFKIAKKKLKE
jgi:hypothetical protein